MLSVNRRTFLKGLLFAALIPKFLIPKEEIPSNAILHNGQIIGYKGKSSFDAGFIYCPYIPLKVVKC